MLKELLENGANPALADSHALVAAAGSGTMTLSPFY
jgi:hypothetical protein